jgi:hypothetical protein
VKLTEDQQIAIKIAMEFLVYAEIRNEGVDPGNAIRATMARETLRSMLDSGGLE